MALKDQRLNEIFNDFRTEDKYKILAERYIYIEDIVTSAEFVEIIKKSNISFDNLMHTSIYYFHILEYIFKKFPETDKGFEELKNALLKMFNEQNGYHKDGNFIFLYILTCGRLDRFKLFDLLTEKLNCIHPFLFLIPQLLNRSLFEEVKHVLILYSNYFHSKNLIYGITELKLDENQVFLKILNECLNELDYLDIEKECLKTLIVDNIIKNSSIDFTPKVEEGGSAGCNNEFEIIKNKLFDNIKNIKNAAEKKDTITKLALEIMKLND
jgi:hypothetical protein